METFNSRPILLPLVTYRSLLKGTKRVVQRLSHPLSFLLSTVFEFELFRVIAKPPLLWGSISLGCFVFFFSSSL